MNIPKAWKPILPPDFPVTVISSTKIPAQSDSLAQFHAWRESSHWIPLMCTWPFVPLQLMNAATAPKLQEGLELEGIFTFYKWCVICDLTSIVLVVTRVQIRPVTWLPEALCRSEWKHPLVGTCTADWGCVPWTLPKISHRLDLVNGHGCWHGTLLYSDANGVLEFFFPGGGHFILFLIF